MWFKGIRLSEQLLSFCLLESCGNLDRIVHADIVGGGGGVLVCVYGAPSEKQTKLSSSQFRK